MRNAEEDECASDASSNSDNNLALIVEEEYLCKNIENNNTLESRKLH